MSNDITAIIDERPLNVTIDENLINTKIEGAIINWNGGQPLESITSIDGSISAIQSAENVNLTTNFTKKLLVDVRNNTGSTLTKGTAVYINGAIGQISTVAKAQANSDATSAQTLGLITENLPKNTNGKVTVIGLLDNLNTSSYTDGQQLYLSPTTAGALTATKPLAPQHLVYVAVVEHSHPTQGKLMVKVQNGYELDELHDVDAKNPSNNDFIKYNSTSGIWDKTQLKTIENQSILGAGNIDLTKSDVGLNNVDNTSDINKPISNLTQTALNNKVDKILGKSLSTEDYTTIEKNKLANIESNAQVNTVNSVANKTGIVTLTKSDVGLGNVDNTSDLNKPISTATQTAINAKQDTLISGTNIKTINGNSVLGSGNININSTVNWGNITGTLSNQTDLQIILDNKVNKIVGKGLSTEDYTTTEKNKLAGIENGAQVNTVNSVAGKTGTVTLTKSDVGLSNIDNTSDANKPISTAVQTALNAKEDIITAGTTSQYYRGDKTFQTLNKSSVGLSNVDNTSDANKPISTATQTALNSKADLVGGLIPSNQLPSYVDDVLEYANLASFPVTGESGKIYVALDTNLTYRWTGSTYGNLDPSLALGETSTTAYRGDRGKTAYDHSQSSGNPHNTTKSDIGLGNVDNTSDVNKPISTAVQTALDGKVDENITITGATKTKITYDSKGLVTTGADAGISDITGLQTALDNKVDKVVGKGLSTEDYTTTEKNKLAGIASGAEVNVNADWNAISGDAQILNKPTISGTNTGDQTSIVGITGTRSEFDTAVTDGNFLYVGDVSQYTDELAQDAVGTILTDTTSIDLIYDDANNTISAQREALTGAITASKNNNTTSLGSFTVAQLNTALSDGDIATGGGTATGTNTGDQNTFNTIAVAGQSDVIADAISDTLTLVAGTNISLTTNSTSDSITINASGGGNTNLAYVASTTDGTVTSDTGTDATIPLVSTNAGLMSPSDKTKLDGIASGAEVNVNADWNAVSGDAQILNKPTIPTQYTDELAQDAIGEMVDSTLSYIDATPSLGVVNNTSTQKIILSESGTVIGTRKQINLIEGTNFTITATDDSVNDRINATFGLTNNAITIAGTSTSLGGTITQDTITGLNTTGIIKRTGANTLAISTDGTDYYSSSYSIPNANIPNGISNGSTSLQSQTVVSGTAYYITNSALTMPATSKTGGGMSTSTRMSWRVGLTKTAAGTGTFQIRLYRGLNGTTADTADATITLGTQTAAIDTMMIEVSIAVTATGATGSYFYSITPINKAATATGFGVTSGATFTGTVSGVALNTASLRFGLGFISTTGTPTITAFVYDAYARNMS